MRCVSLIRPRISGLAAFSCAAGYCMLQSPANAEAILLVAGVFLLAGGAGGLNQYQERAADALMLRTRNRPIPSGLMSPRAALAASTAFILSGLTMAWLSAGAAVALMGALAVLVYNALYTPLKKHTAFAMVLGAVSGVMPPLMGFAAAGGTPGDMRAAYLAAFFYLWQMPHAWAIQLRHAEDYARAGLPAVTDVLTRPQTARLTLTWSLATVASGLMLVASGPGASYVAMAGLLIAGAWLAARGARVGMGSTQPHASAYAMAVALTVCAGTLIA